MKTHFKENKSIFAEMKLENIKLYFIVKFLSKINLYHVLKSNVIIYRRLR